MSHNRFMPFMPVRVPRKHVATLVAALVVLACIVFFFQSRRESRPLDVVAGRIGLKADDLTVMGARVASRSGATLGTSRRLVYLMACSGATTGTTLEAEATRAADLAEKRGLTPRQAATALLSQTPSTDAEEALRNC